MEIVEKIYNAILDRDEAEVIKLSNEIVEKGIDPVLAIENGFRRGMQEIGEKFERLEIYLPEMIMAAEIMKKGMGIMRPILKSKKEGTSTGKILLGTIQGDVHDIGKNIVRVLLEGSGFEVIDLGMDVSVLTFIAKMKELNAEIMAISTLMTSTMENIPKLIENLERMGLRDQIMIMVGGAPVLPEWADEIGADGYGEYAAKAVELAREWTR